MANPTATYGDLLNRVARRGHKTRSRSDEEQDIQHWVTAGIERVENEMAWPHLGDDFTITLAADTYEYDLPNSIYRIDEESMRYAGEGSYLKHERRPANIDGVLGPTWRDSGTDASTPEYWCLVGQKLWIGPKPSTAFVAANPTIYGYGWKSDLYAISQISDTTDSTEVDAVSLFVPLFLRELYVMAALAEGLQQEDDPEWRAIDDKYNNIIIRIRGDQNVVRVNTRPQVPDWVYLMEF